MKKVVILAVLLLSLSGCKFITGYDRDEYEARRCSKFMLGYINNALGKKLYPLDWDRIQPFYDSDSTQIGWYIEYHYTGERPATWGSVGSARFYFDKNIKYIHHCCHPYHYWNEERLLKADSTARAKLLGHGPVE